MLHRANLRKNRSMTRSRTNNLSGVQSELGTVYTNDGDLSPLHRPKTADRPHLKRCDLLCRHERSSKPGIQDAAMIYANTRAGPTPSDWRYKHSKNEQQGSRAPIADRPERQPDHRA